MKREYSKRQIRKILSRKVEVPDRIEKRIADTYDRLGLGTQVTMRYTKRHRAFTAAAAVCVLVAGMSVVTLAASKFLSANLEEKDGKLTYDVKVDKTKTAHKIEAKPSYIPQGYVLQDKNTPMGGKWYNQETGGTMTILSYNAAELYNMGKEGGDFAKYAKDSHIKSMSVSGMKADVFASDGFYADDKNTPKNLYLFNEDYGYGVWINVNSDLPADEVIKVAKGMKVKVLDETVPYAGKEDKEEQAKEKGAKLADEQSKDKAQREIKAGDIYGIGQEISDPLLKNPEQGTQVDDDIRFTVENVQIQDAISLSDYPANNFVDDISPWMEADGTLKPHQRYKTLGDVNFNTDHPTAETANSKYVIVKLKAKNCGDSQSETNKDMGIGIWPDLTQLVPSKDGSLKPTPYSYLPANKDYSLQWKSGNGASFPVYFDKIYYTEGTRRLQDALFHPLKAGEELEYTLIYVADDDVLDNLYLGFFTGDNTVGDMPAYVKVPKG